MSLKIVYNDDLYFTTLSNIEYPKEDGRFDELMKMDDLIIIPKTKDLSQCTMAIVVSSKKIAGAIHNNNGYFVNGSGIIVSYGRVSPQELLIMLFESITE